MLNILYHKEQRRKYKTRPQDHLAVTSVTLIGWAAVVEKAKSSLPSAPAAPLPPKSLEHVVFPRKGPLFHQGHRASSAALLELPNSPTTHVCHLRVAGRQTNEAREETSILVGQRSSPTRGLLCHLVLSLS